eukprot:g10699.t1
MQDPPCLSQAVPGSTRDEKDADWMRLLIMREARTNGAAAACKKYGVSYWKARYLEMKSFGAHPIKHGGRRYSTLTPAAQLLLEWSAFIIWSEAPRNGDYQVMQMLKEHLGWDWMEGGPDGSARTVQGCKSYPGQRVVLQQDLGTDSETAFSGTLITSLRHPNGAALVSLREGTNSALDWQDSITVMAAYEAGMFVRGDKLILDNARVHTARDVVEPLKVLLAGVGVELVFLPAYSPEFNPCELAFGMLNTSFLLTNITIRYDTIRYNMIRYDTIRYDTIRYDTIGYDTIRYDTIRYDTIRYDTIRYDRIQDDTIRYDTIRYDTIRYDTIRYDTLQYATI